MSEAPAINKVTLDLPDDQALALAQLCKRFSRSHAELLSSAFTHYRAGLEVDVMIAAVIALQIALAQHGFEPR